MRGRGNLWLTRCNIDQNRTGCPFEIWRDDWKGPWTSWSCKNTPYVILHYLIRIISSSSSKVTITYFRCRSFPFVLSHYCCILWASLKAHPRWIAPEASLTHLPRTLQVEKSNCISSSQGSFYEPTPTPHNWAVESFPWIVANASKVHQFGRGWYQFRQGAHHRVPLFRVALWDSYDNTFCRIISELFCICLMFHYQQIDLWHSWTPPNRTERLPLHHWHHLSIPPFVSFGGALRSGTLQLLKDCFWGRDSTKVRERWNWQYDLEKMKKNFIESLCWGWGWCWRWGRICWQ